MTVSAGGWSAATASVRGAAHERSGKPNQDAVRVEAVTGATPGLVAAVCDGHGGDRYIRSDVGSRLGVEVACAVGGALLTEMGPTPSTEDLERRIRDQVATSIVTRWRSAVDDHLREAPFTDDERARTGVALDDDPYVSYGATLVVAVLAQHWVGLLQIGDGDVTISSGGTTISPVPGDDRLVGGETTSLCLPNAAGDVRVASMVGSLPDLVILTSDGYANSFASSQWRSDIVSDLSDRLDSDGLDGIEQRLPSWLGESARAGGDDVSMALIHRDGTRPAVGVAKAEQTPPRETGRRSGMPWWTVVAALAVGLLVGGVGAVALGADDDAEPRASSTTTPQTLPPTTTTTVGVAALADGEEIVYFSGPSGHTIVALCRPDEPGARARTVETVAQDGLAPPLPADQGWTLDAVGGSAWELRRFDTVVRAGVDAVSWDRARDVVWTLSDLDAGPAVVESWGVPDAQQRSAMDLVGPDAVDATTPCSAVAQDVVPPGDTDGAGTDAPGIDGTGTAPGGTGAP